MQFARYDQKRKLSGLIYFQRISDPRFGVKSVLYLRMFQKLCGLQAYKNVVVLTTFWDQVTHEIGARQEAQLMLSVFAELVEGGAKFIRHDNTVESTRKVLSHIFPMPPTITQIQTEMGKEGKSLSETSVGAVLSKEVEQGIANYKKEIDDLKATMAAIEKSNNAARQELEMDLVMLQDLLDAREWEHAKLKGSWRRFLSPDSLR